MKVAFLTTFFVGEYGVTRVIAAQMPLLSKAGHRVDLYACFLDRALVPEGVSAVRVPTHFKGLKECLQRGGYDVIIACTEQFFSLQAQWKLDAITIAYEHGYIPVELTIPEERESHRRMIDERIQKIYPAFSYVVTISKYAVDYIRWPKAFVLYNGADHFETAFAKTAGSEGRPSCNEEGPIRVLAVSRYREVEWLGKGLDDLCRLKKELGDRVEITIVGGGDEKTGERLKEAGILALGVIRDASEMHRMYCSCDVLLSFSRCEMFNLPLAEAGFAHKPGYALNVCAHPEITPFTFECYEQIKERLENSTRRTLAEEGERMFLFVNERFRWQYNAQRLMEFLNSVCREPNGKSPSLGFHLRRLFWQGREAFRQSVYRIVGRRK